MGKSGLCLGLTIVPHICTDCHEISELITPGTLRASTGLYRDCFTFTKTTSYEIAAECNTALKFLLFLFPAIKYVNTFHKKHRRLPDALYQAWRIVLEGACPNRLHKFRRKLFTCPCAHRNYEDQNKVLEPYTNQY